MRDKFITFGEIMLRISPGNKGKRIFQENNFLIEPGGSESNVAVSLSNLGCKVKFITSLPDNYLKHIILRYLRQYGIDVSGIVFSGNKLGMYWTENGISVRPSKVIYDRDNSSFSNSKYEDYNWKDIFEDGKWLHTSGITAALNKSTYEMLSEILKEAKLKGFTNSLDLNYRSSLWNWVNKGSQMYQVYIKLCDLVDLIIGNETDFYDCLGIDNRIKKGKSHNIDNMSVSTYESIADEIFSKFNNLKYMAMSLRKSISASENKWQGMLAARSGNKVRIFESKEYNINGIVDRIGAGDSFSAGIIFGLNKYPGEYQKIIDFATAFSCLKHTITGDACEFFEDDVVYFIDTEGTGRIVR
jgi:2-dehydro-3-deoxygluconokinase